MNTELPSHIEEEIERTKKYNDYRNTHYAETGKWLPETESFIHKSHDIFYSNWVPMPMYSIDEEKGKGIRNFIITLKIILGNLMILSPTLSMILFPDLGAWRLLLLPVSFFGGWIIGKQMAQLI